MHTRSRLNNPTKRWGGKSNLAPWIIGHLPHHRVYVEALAASASVLMSKPPSKLEVINDIDDIWVNTYFVIRDQAEDLAAAVECTPYSRTEFESAREILPRWKELKLSALEVARLHIVLVRQSFSAGGQSWSRSTVRGENRAKLWAKLPDVIIRAMHRLRGVYIECRDYKEVLRRYDGEDTTFYLDPPYVGVEKNYYAANQAEGFDHDELRLVVDDLKGSVVISYYRSDYILKLYDGWRMASKKVTVHTGDTKRQETELLIIRASEFGRKRRKRMQPLFDDDGKPLLL